MILAPDHPNADSRGYIYEHRLVASLVLDRPLRPGEVVHHDDHVKNNNTPDNLAVFVSQSAHMRHHATEKNP
jgi:hypothetical protein